MCAFGKLYLIPSPIGTQTPSLAPECLEIVRALRNFAVEEPRTARRFLSALTMPVSIAELNLLTLNKDSGTAPIEASLSLLRQGNSLGIISEAGMPGVADPGAELVARAHEAGIEVVPLVGASSILLTLAASGLNGQSFAFWGYLPIKNNERRAKLQELETRSRHEQQTQLFIETPYRNETMLAELLTTLTPTTLLCIANGIHWEGGSIRTQRIAEWRKMSVTLGKLPTVFALLAQTHKSYSHRH